MAARRPSTGPRLSRKDLERMRQLKEMKKHEQKFRRYYNQLMRSRTRPTSRRG